MPFIMDFAGRKGLKELGYTDSIDDVDMITVQAFMLIADQFSRYHKMRMDKLGH
jgi:hypothetical protein